MEHLVIQRSNMNIGGHEVGNFLLNPEKFLGMRIEAMQGTAPGVEDLVRILNGLWNSGHFRRGQQASREYNWQGIGNGSALAINTNYSKSGLKSGNA